MVSLLHKGRIRTIKNFLGKGRFDGRILAIEGFNNILHLLDPLAILLILYFQFMDSYFLRTNGLVASLQLFQRKIQMIRPHLILSKGLFFVVTAKGSWWVTIISLYPIWRFIIHKSRTLMKLYNLLLFWPFDSPKWLRRWWMTNQNRRLGIFINWSESHSIIIIVIFTICNYYYWTLLSWKAMDSESLNGNMFMRLQPVYEQY